MTTTLKAAPLTMRALTAAELMSLNPISIRAEAPVHEAVAFLCDRGFGAAPVCDEAGRPVGVVSRSDLLTHDRETLPWVMERPEYYTRAELAAATGEDPGSGYHVEWVDRTTVRDIMTPVVFAVAPDASVRAVIEQMLGYKVHRLFVVDISGVLVGVISMSDILKHLIE
jgi:CBS domain-containing protein